MKRLSAKQKKINKAKYKAIRKEYKRNAAVNQQSTYLQFKHRVEKQLLDNKDYTVKQAIKKAANTRRYVTAAESSRKNLLNAIKEKDKEAYKELRLKARNEKGQFTKIDVSNLTWDRDKGGYVLNDKYFIDVSNSPEGINIYEI